MRLRVDIGADRGGDRVGVGAIAQGKADVVSSTENATTLTPASSSLALARAKAASWALQ